MRVRGLPPECNGYLGSARGILEIYRRRLPGAERITEFDVERTLWEFSVPHVDDFWSVGVGEIGVRLPSLSALTPSPCPVPELSRRAYTTCVTVYPACVRQVSQGVLVLSRASTDGTCR
eukprot:scaffold6286_cov106-Isochrysis_galbana.AAC.2